MYKGLKIIAGLRTRAMVDQSATSSAAVTCRLTFLGASEEAVREVLGGGELPGLDLAVDLQPSTAPSSIQLLHDGQAVPLKVWRSKVYKQWGLLQNS